VLLQLAAQGADMHIHHAVDAGEVGTPDTLEQILAGKDAAGVAGQRVEQIELARGQLDLAALTAHLAALRVDAEQAELKRRALGGLVARGARAAQDRLDAGDELAGAEGLGEVVVGADRAADQWSSGAPPTTNTAI